MNIWVDAQLPPTLADWLSRTFEVHARSLKDLGLRDALDTVIFDAARIPGTVIMTKDSDESRFSLPFGYTTSNSLVNMW